MTSKNLFRATLVSAALACGALGLAQAKDAAASAPAATKHTGTHQNHHCKQSDGTMDTSKTKKACLADKGTWVKDGQADAATAAPAAAASAAAKK